MPAPLLGNFYAAPRPGEPPFVEPATRSTEDTVIGIIEVMKLMNSIRAGVAGTVVAILAVERHRGRRRPAADPRAAEG